MNKLTDERTEYQTKTPPTPITLRHCEHRKVYILRTSNGSNFLYYEGGNRWTKTRAKAYQFFSNDDAQQTRDRYPQFHIVEIVETSQYNQNQGAQAQQLITELEALNTALSEQLAQARKQQQINYQTWLRYSQDLMELEEANKRLRAWAAIWKTAAGGYRLWFKRAAHNAASIAASVKPGAGEPCPVCDQFMPDGEVE